MGSGRVGAEEEKPREGRAGKLPLTGRVRDGQGTSPRSPFERSVLVFCPALCTIATKKRRFLLVFIRHSFIPIPFPDVADLVKNLVLTEKTAR